MIVIGLGSGRSGTASLAKLLNAQHDALCFHEMNPSCVRFEGTPRPVLNTIDEFRAVVDGGDPSMLTVDLSRRVAAQAYDAVSRMERVRLLGDIAFYYLSYVELIARHDPDVRFLCLKRDRQATIDSWLRKSTIDRWPSKRLADRLASLVTRTPYRTAYNHWMAHDGREWAVDEVWDKCFPKFPGPTRAEAIAQYYDFYYAEADRLAALLPERFRIVPTTALNDRGVQRSLLAFCGVAPERQVEVDAHIHGSGDGARRGG
jgi:hypothetical protein